MSDTTDFSHLVEHALTDDEAIELGDIVLSDDPVVLGLLGWIRRVLMNEPVAFTRGNSSKYVSEALAAARDSARRGVLVEVLAWIQQLDSTHHTEPDHEPVAGEVHDPMTLEQIVERRKPVVITTALGAMITPAEAAAAVDPSIAEEHADGAKWVRVDLGAAPRRHVIERVQYDGRGHPIYLIVDGHMVPWTSIVAIGVR